MRHSGGGGGASRKPYRNLAGPFLAAALLLICTPLRSAETTPDPGLAGARERLAAGDRAASLAILEAIPKDSPSAPEASLERASLLIQAGRPGDASALLASLSFPGRETRAAAVYLQGVAAWKQGNKTEAAKFFSSVPQATPWLASAAVLGAVLAGQETTGPARSIRLLEKQISKGAPADILAVQFRLLDRLYAEDAVPDTTVLDSWSSDTSHPERARLARYYRAVNDLRLGRTAQGESGLATFLKENPSDPLASSATIRLALSQLAGGKPGDALLTAADRTSDPDPLRARLAYLRGLALASSGQNDKASSEFTLAGSLDPSLGENVLFNRAVLMAIAGRGSLDRSESARSLVAAGGAGGEEMELQIALDAARRGDREAAPLLRSVADYCKDPSVRSRARVAAAELDMASGKGESALADFSKALREGSQRPEREEYLRIFLSGNGEKVIPGCRAFLESHPDSPFAPDVRLRLAEALLGTGDLQGARSEFELLAATAPQSDLARDSLFLAARSASGAMDPGSIDDSLMLLERVAGKSSDRMTWQARLQEGALKNAQSLPAEALAIYDRILSSDGTDPDLLSATLMAKGDTLHQSGARDPATEREAVAVWKRLAADASLPLDRRILALCKSGLALESLGETDAALACFDEAFRIPATDSKAALWRDKAAFEAARLLAKGKRWNEAVALYGAVIAGGGERAGEAKARLSKLRLENFLWDN